MDLMVDIGNTHTVLGLFDDNTLKRHWRVTSQLSRTEDEIWVVIDSLFHLENLNPKHIKGVCISSVVPELSRTYKRMIEKHLSLEPMYISPELNIGLKILYQDPHSVGADRICNSVAGKRKFGCPLIILDF